MKNSEEIISQIMTPFGSRWQDRRCIKTLFHFLPSSMTRAVRYAKFQENTLVIALESSALRAEFYQKRSVIKAIFDKVRSETEICKDKELNEFRFVLLPPLAKPAIEKPFFYELSSGEFTNRSKDEAVYNIIEEIRAVIKKRRKKAEEGR